MCTCHELLLCHSSDELRLRIFRHSSCHPQILLHTRPAPLTLQQQQQQLLHSLCPLTLQQLLHYHSAHLINNYYTHSAPYSNNNTHSAPSLYNYYYTHSATTTTTLIIPPHSTTTITLTLLQQLLHPFFPLTLHSPCPLLKQLLLHSLYLLVETTITPTLQ